jgi:hypothetical protein
VFIFGRFGQGVIGLRGFPEPNENVQEERPDVHREWVCRDVRPAGQTFGGAAILAAGVNPTSALVLSQVVLSFGIPFALVPLVILTSRRDVMGPHDNQRRTIIAGGLCVAVIVALNMLLLGRQFLGS